MSNQKYQRLRLTGVVETTHPLHIGNGELQQSDNNQQLPLALLERDCENNPCIPASTLRGMLRAAAKRYQLPKAQFQLLFGDDKGEQSENGAGALRVYTATLVAEECEIQHQPRLKIDPITGTAQAHHLFASEQVPAGVRFKLHLEIDPVGVRTLVPALLTELAALLQQLSESGTLQLGKGESLGQGGLRWIAEQEILQGISKADFESWLRGGVELQPNVQALFRPLPGRQPKSRLKSPTPPLAIQLGLYPQSPWLISDRVEAQQSASQRSTENRADSEPSATVQQVVKGGKTWARVPGSSLKGLLRGHCRKILYTLAQPEENQHAGLEAMLAELFGSTDKRGCLSIAEALSEAPLQTHQQFFNAIDRFSGAVRDGALFHVEAAANARLSTQLMVDPHWLNANHWAQALLLLLFRDGYEGDLRLGWGRGRGYGHLVTRTWLKGSKGGESLTWQALQERWQQQFRVTPQTLMEALEQRLAKATQHDSGERA